MTNSEIDVQLESPNGPRVIVSGEHDEREILAALPDGWTIHVDGWANAVRLSPSRVSYPISRA